MPSSMVKSISFLNFVARATFEPLPVTVEARWYTNTASFFDASGNPPSQSNVPVNDVACKGGKASKS